MERERSTYICIYTCRTFLLSRHNGRWLIDSLNTLNQNLNTKREVDALGVITMSPGCLERCCSNKKTPPSSLTLVSYLFEPDGRRCSVRPHTVRRPRLALGDGAATRVGFFEKNRTPGVELLAPQLGLYKIFVYFEAVEHESTILSPPPRPPPFPILVQYHRTITGQFTTPPPTSGLCAIHHTTLGITISCKGQPTTRTRAALGGRIVTLG